MFETPPSFLGENTNFYGDWDEFLAAEELSEKIRAIFHCANEAVSNLNWFENGGQKACT